MSAQPDIKRKLVYSTVGQMGFMTLQCAAGATGAALFHMIAHGLFKCHMFLQSGSASAQGLSKRKYSYVSSPTAPSKRLNYSLLAVALTACFSISCTAFLPDSWTAISTAVTGAAILSLLPGLVRIDIRALLAFCLLTFAAGLAMVAGGSLFEHLAQPTAYVNQVVVPLCLLFFAGVALALSLARNTEFARKLYVHSLNGFYV